MDIAKELFICKAPLPDKLLSYGFTRENGEYCYRTVLPFCDFSLEIVVAESGKVQTTVIDPAFGESYTLHLVDTASGSFVAGVREDYEHILRDIAQKCFLPDVFKSEQAKELIAFVKEHFGDQPEFLWEKFTDNAVWRRKDTRKWYGALLTVKACKLGLPSEEPVEVIDLRIKPEQMEILIDRIRYFPGYHMNKKHWYTVVLDGSVPTEELCRRLEGSYLLAK